MKNTIQHTTIKIIKNHTQKIKYIGVILFFVSIIITTKTYINYLTIQETIQKTQNKIINKNNEIAFTENFVLPYQDSEYRDFFFSHKNNILFHWEKIIMLDRKNWKENEPNDQNKDTLEYMNMVENETETKKGTWWKHAKMSAPESRNTFFREKRKEL